MPRRKLKWGQTPFHKMTKAELLKHSVKMYDALVATRSVLSQFELGQEHNPYWSYEGTGKRALEKANQCVEPIEAQYGSEAIYRNFYRYAMDLLWTNDKAKLHWDWMICPVCGLMVADKRDEGSKCSDVIGSLKKCQGILRPIRLNDLLKPKV